MFKKTILLLPMLMLIACSCGLDRKKESSQQVKTVPVTVTKPQVRDVPVFIESVGRLRPGAFVEIRSQISGQIQAVHVKEGQTVDKGDVLFGIDPKVHQIAVREAEAQAAVERAAFASASKKLQRLQGLAAKDLISKNEWEDLEAQATKAEAMQMLSEARLAKAMLDVERCTLTAPERGTLGKIEVYPGALVTSGQTHPIATLSQLEHLIVDFTVTEKEYRHLKQKNLKVSVETLCEKCEEIQGEITFIDTSFNAETGRLPVQATLENRLGRLHPGQVVRVRIVIHVRPGVLLLPQYAVKYNSKGPYVYIVDETKIAQLRHVVLGDEVDEDVIIADGLEPSDVVVETGHLRLCHGTAVDIKL